MASRPKLGLSPAIRSILSLTSRYVNGNAAGPLKVGGEPYSIVFKASAGITNLSRAGGRYAIKVDDLDTDATHVFAPIFRSRAR